MIDGPHTLSLVTKVAARSDGGYVLIRFGFKHGVTGSALEWRVNTRHHGRGYRNTGASIREALLRAFARLEPLGPPAVPKMGKAWSVR